eukprot:gene9969-6847_t
MTAATPAQMTGDSSDSSDTRADDGDEDDESSTTAPDPRLVGP